MIKRLFEILFSFLILLITFPIILIAAISIYVEDRNNPFFWQIRLGKNRNKFWLYKLRTMKVDSPQLGTHEVNNDLYLKSSYLIRKLKIDELPQFLNVILGDMTIVGPRPCLPSQNRLIEARISKGVFNFIPGVTGIAQLMNIMMNKEELQSSLDSLYDNKETKSVFFYLYCIINTAYKFDKDLKFLKYKVVKKFLV